MDRAFLSILTDEGVRRVPLGQDTVSIGRGEQNTIVILDLQSSRFHCQIVPTGDGRWMVRDLDSRNGTKLNGKRIREAMLGKGDVVRIGTTEIRLTMMTSEPPPLVEAEAFVSPANQPAMHVPYEQAPVEELDSLELIEEFSPVEHPLDPPRRLTPMTAPPARFTPVHPTPVSLQPVIQKVDLPPGKNGEEKLDDLEVVDGAATDHADAIVDLSAFEPKDTGLLKLELEPPPPSPATRAEAAKQETSVAVVVPPIPEDVRRLRDLADPLPELGFGEEDIALLLASGVAASIDPSKEPWTTCGDAAGTLRVLLMLTARAHATEIHFEPRAEEFQLRLRLDGSMWDLCRVTRGTGNKLSSLIKALCDIEWQAGRNIVQEGKFGASAGNRRIGYLVNFVPVLTGQKMVARVQDGANAPLHVPDLRLPEWMHDEVSRSLASDSGFVLVSGTGGVGRTTTLYAMLRDAGISSRNVTAIEDPVEAEIDGVTQVLVNADQGYTFPALLRSLLRQDPDVVMVGELRDPETAKIALQASATGRLLLTSIHARDGVSALSKLVEWGVAPYLIASGLQVTINQRLVRQLCVHCRKAVAPTDDQKLRLGEVGKGVSEIFIPEGCPKCLKTGFIGRRAFFEAIVPTDEVREAILKGATPKEMEKAFNGVQFERLSVAGYRLVAEGVTPMQEVERAVGPRGRS